MKRTSRNHRTRRNGDDLRPEYDFSAGVRGKHAARHAEGTNVVLLDPDVAAVFPNPVTVNDVLRALAPFVRPQKGSPARKRKHA
jgi:hypothetical protein